MTRRCLHLLVSTLALVGCSGAPGSGPIGPGPIPNAPSGYSGTLVAEATGSVYTFDLADPASAWQSRTILSSDTATSVVASQNEFIKMSDSMGSLAEVEILDLDTFALEETFTWSDDESVSRVRGVAASQDGQYLAALLEGAGPDYLEVLERSGRRVVYSGLSGIFDDRMVWTSDNRLVFVLSLGFLDDPERAGALAAIPLERFLSATSPNIDIDLYVIFSEAEWGQVPAVGDIALSADGTQLAYTRDLNLWVTDFVQGATPHQLTTGPRRIGGAQFSPDGKSLAVVAGNIRSPTESYIIPNHRAEPIVLDFVQGAGSEYLLRDDTFGELVDAMLAWLP